VAVSVILVKQFPITPAVGGQITYSQLYVLLYTAYVTEIASKMEYY
jgi:hypothetical protein